MNVWDDDPHSGGVKIPEKIKEKTKKRIINYAEKHYTGKYTRIDVRYKTHFCYIDAYVEAFVPEDYNTSFFSETREERIERLYNTPTHLCRMRYKGNEEKWTLAFYTYSHNKIVEEIRGYRKQHTDKYDNDLDKIFEALKKSEKESGKKYVNFEPKLLLKKTCSY